jgi:hypothetical protein
MLRFLTIILFVFVVVVVACKKDNPTTVSQAIINEYSGRCGADSCTPKIVAVDLDGIDYIAVFSNAPCNSSAAVYYHREGIKVQDASLIYTLSTRGKFKEVLWQCP